MRYTRLLLKTTKEAKEFDSVNATLLQKGGFIDQTMAGVYTYLPLGLRVLNKIEDIVREEMDTIASEILMPALSPTTIWENTGRLETMDVLFEAQGGNEASRQKNDSRYVLNSTHEELVTPIVQQYKPSYKDLPFAVYQIQSKFRNEPRPKSGLLRGREFRMKDLYSFHVTDEDFKEFYEKAKQVYMKTFERLGLGDDTHEVLASGGAFTTENSHEYQTVCDTGEDEIYFNESEGTYYNKEIASKELMDSVEPVFASEVGNIFPLGTKYSDAINYFVTGEGGERIPVHMGCYGIGTSRVMGVMVEKFNDDRGIIWPEAIAPFTVYLAALQMDDEDVAGQAEKVYEALESAGVDVLFDDRASVSPGEKLGDADLLGIPIRVVVSKKTGDQVEVKRRKEQDSEMMSLEGLLELV